MLFSTLLAGKAVAVVGAGVIVLSGGTAAAAYAGVLPASLQDVAHTVVGAPAADPSVEPSESGEHSESADPSESGTPSESADPSKSPESSESPEPSESSDPSDSPSPGGSPSAETEHGHSAWGPCNAYLHGGLPQHSQGYAKLAALAGTGTVDAFCATVVKPGAPRPVHPHPAKHHPAKSHGHGHGNGSGKHHGSPTPAPTEPAPRTSPSA